MGCLLALVAAISPRFVIFLLWVFSDRLTVAFHSAGRGSSLHPLAVHHALLRARLFAGTGVDSFGWFIVALACCSTSLRTPSVPGRAGAGSAAGPPPRRTGAAGPARAEGRSAGTRDLELVPAGHADHGSVVVAMACGGISSRAPNSSASTGPGAEDGAGRHAAHDGYSGVAELLEGAAQLGR